jgi:3-hydroxymyristoyl/3-hydroxydecanoyl-(acyl carrier protein) dehydratase
MDNNLTLPMSADKLVPHRPPLCFVKRLLEFSAQTGIVESVIESDNIFLNEDGSIPTLTLVEVIAQAAATVKGYDNLLQGEGIKKGFLVDIREIRFMGQCFRGDRLLIRIEILRTISGFSIVRGEAARNGEIIALGTIKLWVTEDSNLEQHAGGKDE